MNQLQQLLENRFTAEEKKEVKILGISNSEYESGGVSESQDGRIEFKKEYNYCFFLNGVVETVDFSNFPNLEKISIHDACGKIQAKKLILTQNKNLTTLYLYNNQLTNIDLKENKNLTTLNLRNNQLTNIDLKENKNLTTLNLYNNQLTNIDLKENKNLTTLNLRNNQLTNIDLKENKNLTTLNLYNNQLTNIDLKENKNLTTLYLYNNQLTNIDLKENKNLTTLNLRNNQLTNIDLKENKNLTTLNLEYNKLTNIDLKENKNLTTLNLEYNKLTNIDLKEEIIDKITSLNLSNNPLLTQNPNQEPKTLLKRLARELAEKEKEAEKIFGKEREKLLQEIREYKEKIINQEQQETALSNQIQQLQEKLMQAQQDDEEKRELEKKIKVLQDLIISNREELKTDYENKEQAWEETITNLRKIVQDQEQEIQNLQNKIIELQEKIEEWEGEATNYEKLEKECKECKEQLLILKIRLAEKNASANSYQQQWNNVNNNAQQTKQKIDEKNEVIINQIEDIINNDEKNEEFINSLENEENRSYGRNKNFFLDWLFEFSKIDEKFAYDAFCKLYPQLDMMTAEEFAAQVKKDLLITEICQNDKVALIPYLLATKRTKKKLGYLIQDNNIMVVRFFMSNIGKSDVLHSFYGSDPIFTSQNWKIVKQTEKQKKIKELKKNIAEILDLSKNDIIDETKLKETEKIMKILTDEKEKDHKQFEALNKFLTDYPPTNYLLKQYWEEWQEAAGKKEATEDKKEDSWEEMGNYFKELDKKGFLSYYCRKRKWDEKRMREVINAFLESIHGTIKKDNNYYQLPKLDLNKTFEELIPWKPEGVYFGHKTSTGGNGGGLDFNIPSTPPPSPFFKPFSNIPDEEIPTKKSIYSWYSSNTITLKDFFKCQKLSQAEVIENNLYNKTYTLEQVKEILKQEEPKIKTKKNDNDIKNYLKTLQEDCEEYLKWQTGNITNKWYEYWEKTQQTLKKFNLEQVKKGLQKILNELTPLTTKWDSEEKKTRNKNLQKAINELLTTLTTEKPKNGDLYTGWLTDDNIEFILRSNDFEINSSEEVLAENDYFTIGDFTVRTDLANIYNSYYKAKTSQEWDLADFIDTMNKSKYTIFPLRVSGNHWGMFVIEKDNLDYKVYYTSSGTSGITNEVREIQPLITQLTDQQTAKNIQVLAGDKQKDGHNCGIYSLFYIKEILETQELELKRTYTQQEIKVFREKWHNLIGEEKWCKEDTNFYI